MARLWASHLWASHLEFYSTVERILKCIASNLDALFQSIFVAVRWSAVSLFRTYCPPPRPPPLFSTDIIALPSHPHLYACSPLTFFLLHPRSERKGAWDPSAGAAAAKRRAFTEKSRWGWSRRGGGEEGREVSRWLNPESSHKDKPLCSVWYLFIFSFFHFSISKPCLNLCSNRRHSYLQWEELCGREKRKLKNSYS